MKKWHTLGVMLFFCYSNAELVMSIHQNQFKERSYGKKITKTTNF